MKRTWKAVFIFAAWFLVSLPLVAQDTSYEFNQGFNNYNSFTVGAFDAVNEDNLNLMVDVPIVSYPQRGTLPDYKLNVHYNGWSWYMTCAILNGQQQCRWHPGTYGSAYITDNLTLSGGSRYCSPNNNCFAPCPCRTYWVKDASGAIHNIGATASGNMAIDGSGIKLDSTSSWTTRDGIRISNAGAFLDPSGNAITKTYVAGGGSYTTDSMGRIIPTDVPRDTGGHPVPGCVVRNFPSPNGGTAPITFCSASYTVTSPIPNPNLGINAFPSIFTMGALQSITLPNNTSWNFYYSTGGDLIQITTPTGGSISYTWGNQWLESNSTQAYSRVVLTRTVNANDGTGNKTWTYSATLNGTVQPGVTDPDGNFTVFSNEYSPAPRTNSGVWTRRQYYTSAGVLLKTVDTSYIGAEDHLDRWQIAGSPGLVQYILPVGTTTTFPNGQVTQTILTYDSGATWYDVYTPGSSYYLPYGDVVEKQEYDYGPSPHGPLLRDTKTVYQWQTNASYLNANLFDLIASVNVYDGANNTCKGQTSPCAQTTYAYDENNGSPQGIYGNQTSVTRWLNGGTSPKTQYVYNAQGMRTKMCDPMDTACANPTIYTYDSTGLFLSQVQYPNTGTAHIETFSYDKNTGLLNWHKDQNLQQTTFGYDSMRRLTSVSYPDGGSETYVHTDTIPNPYFTFTKKITSSANFVGTGIVDGFGRGKQTKTTVPTSTCSGGYSYVDTTYDNEGRKYSVSNPYCTTGDSTYGLTETYYDALNRVCLVVPPDGTLPSGNTCPATSPSNDVFTVYSANTTTVTDQAGKTRKWQTDGLGRLTNVWEDPNGLNYQTVYTYDALDNLLSVTQSGSRQRNFVYDSLSRLTQATNPESRTINYTYDSNGNVLTKTDARGITTNYSPSELPIDALNRVRKKTYTNGDPAVTYGYDGNAPVGCSPTLTIANGIGRRTGMCDTAGNEAWSYDVMGRVATDQRTTNGVTKAMTYAPYNYDGSIAQVTYPTGRTIKYTPNAAGQPISAVDTANSINYATLGLYTPHGALKSLLNGANLLSTWYYNNRLQPCRIAVNSSGMAPNTCADSTHAGNVLDFTYNFSAGTSDNGNVAGITNNRDSTRSQTFGYDALNRLQTGQTSSTYSGSPAHCWGESFVYDQAGGPSPWGNLIQINPVSSAYNGCTQENLSIAVDSNNRISTPGFSYDLSGNLTAASATGPTYAYNAESQLKQAATSTTTGYVYDGDGKRVEKTSGGTVYKIYWYGMNTEPLDESDGGGNITDEYIFFNGKRIARRVGP